MTSVLSLLKKIKHKLTMKKISSSFYQIGEESILLPHGIKIDFRTKKEERVYVKIGKKCIINADFIFETEKGFIEIGNNVHIGEATIICRTNVTVGNDVTMAWGITIYDHDSHSIQWDKRMNDNNQCFEDYLKYDGNNIINKDWSNVNSKPITIKDKVWIGFGVTVLKGVTIGEGSVIGAKSVVTKNVPDWSVVAGNPAKVVKLIK